jgi:hypothetical protein
VIVLTARDDQTEKVRSLDAGADDYMTKPFDTEELLARIRAALRRVPSAGNGPVVLRLAELDLEIDLARRLVTRAGEPVHLTRTELMLLELLVRNPGKLLTQEYLLHEVWGSGYGTESNYLRVYVAQSAQEARRRRDAPASDPDRARHRLPLDRTRRLARGVRVRTQPTQPITVAIVPHTHWDREWYEPFQTFRMRLVKLLDTLLPMLEADMSYARFLLDGQTVVIDDYLEIRPDARAALERLAAAGRISVGPWMVLMDEFMVSGETTVRDLQYGLARASELGGAMEVGYLPDMFGHVAQMPQLFRLAGLEHAVAWRGVPAAVEQTAFWWEAPDGSRVRTEYLYGSYSNGRDIPVDAGALVRRACDYEVELGPARLGSMLLMNGTDHQMPQPWLGRVVAEANERQRDYRFVVTSLAEYLPAQPTDGLVTVSGELRSGARANLLMGVGSNRVDVHRACAAAERALERSGEPLSALLLPPDRYPRHARPRRVAQSRVQQRARLFVRVQRRRGRRPGGRALRRSASDRRGVDARRGRAPRVGGRRAGRRHGRHEPDRPSPGRVGGDRRARRRPGAGRRPRGKAAAHPDRRHRRRRRLHRDGHRAEGAVGVGAGA